MGSVSLTVAERSVVEVSSRLVIDWKRSTTSLAVELTGDSAIEAATITATAPNTTRALRPLETTTWATPATISATQAERTKVMDRASVTTITPANTIGRARRTVR